jgi:hypothetical protein
VRGPATAAIEIYSDDHGCQTYKMFVEVGHALLRRGGQLGLVVPSGLHSDKGTAELRRLLLTQCSWRFLYAFENREQIFDIHRSFKFCVSIAEKGLVSRTIRAAFMQHQIDGLAIEEGAVDYPAARVETFSPRSLSILEIRSARDLAVLTKLYSNGVLLGDAGAGAWDVRYAQGDFNMTSDSKLFVARDKAEENGYCARPGGTWQDSEGRTLLPIYEGRMLGQFDFSQKGWLSGKGRGAKWPEVSWPHKRVLPQFLIAEEVVRLEWTKAWLVEVEGMKPKAAALEAPARVGDPATWEQVSKRYGERVAFMEVAAATNQRTMIAAQLKDVPCGHSAALFYGAGPAAGAALAAVLNSTSYDWLIKSRCSGLHLSWFVLDESAVPNRSSSTHLAGISLRLLADAPGIKGGLMRDGWSPFHTALTPHERLRLRCMLDAIVAALYGLDRDDFAWILRDCDHPAARLSDKAFCRTLDPKGFWRVDKTQDPELRHTVLSLAAFDDLSRAIAAAGSRDAGIQAFCDQHDGDGWMLPETLCLADLGLTRSVDVGTYDDRARTPQSVRARMGERFLDWQLAQTPEESWAECERHAKAILEGAPAPSPSDSSGMPTSAATSTKRAPPQQQTSLFGEGR